MARVITAPDVDEDELQLIYNWVDEIPLSRPKRNIARDFADGVLVAEVMKHFLPRIIDLHNYSSANSVDKKNYNWNHLNDKVFRRIGFKLAKNDITDVVNCVPDAIERVLRLINIKIGDAVENRDTFQSQEQDYGRNSPATRQMPMQRQPQGSRRNAEMEEALAEREGTIEELKETIEIMEVKLQKMEQLIKLKDQKIMSLTGKLESAGIDTP